MKRFLSFILSLIMLLSLVPAAAFADTGDVPAQEQTEEIPATVGNSGHSCDHSRARPHEHA